MKEYKYEITIPEDAVRDLAECDVDRHFEFTQALRAWAEDALQKEAPCN